MKNADGVVIIEADLSTKELEKKLKDAEKRLQQFEKEQKDLKEQKINIEAQIEIKDEEFNRKVKAIQEKAKIDVEAITSGTYYGRMKRQEKIENSAQLKINTLTQEYEQYLDRAEEKITGIEEKLVSNETHQKLINEEIADMNVKLNEAKGLDNINNSIGKIGTSINKIGDSLNGTIKKVVKWGLAVFGVRSMYLAIRQAMGVLSGYNEQMGTDIEYIRFALATALQPVVEFILDLVKKILVYTAYILKAWFGINIFANATAKAFEKTNNSVKATNKSAKELQKTLAGFDEMNILQQDGSTKLGGGGGGISAPSIDLSEWENMEVPGWIKWIADNRDIILAALAGIAAGIIGIKIAGLSLMGLGIGVAILGIIALVKSIIDFLQNPTWDGFLKIMYSLELAIAGVALAMIGFNATNPVGWIILAADAIAIFVTALLDWITHLNESRDSIKSVEQATNDLNEAQLALANQEYNNIKAIEDEETAIKKLEDKEKKYHMTAQDLLKIMEEENKTYKDLTPEQRAVYEAYIQLQKAQGRVKTTADAVTEAKKEEVKQSLEAELANAKEANSYDLVKEKAIEAFQQGYISAQEASDYISRAMANMDYETMKVFAEDIPENIKKGLDPYQYKSKMDNMRAWWNGELKKFNDEISLKINTDNLKGGVVMSLAYDRREMAKGGIYIPPKLAVGGVINQPGRGIPLGSAIGGEAGAEGVIPLTDSQQMELLGEAIGRYITVSLTNITELDGRQIARKIDKVRQNDNFVLNR